MKPSKVAIRRVVMAGALLVAAIAHALWPTGSGRPAIAQTKSSAQADHEGVSLALLAQERLPNLPGNSLTAITVELAPGVAPASHRHAGFVFAYVLSGEVRSQLNDGPVRVYKAGESWVEPPGTVHSQSANASRTEPARLLAVFVAKDGAKLTTSAR